MSVEAAEMHEAGPQVDPEEFRDSATRLLSSSVDRRAGYRDAGGDDRASETLYASMVELGWTLLLIPEEAGGLGQGFGALAPIYEEIGRATAPTWIADTLAAGQFLAEIGEGTTDLLERIGSGVVRVAVAKDADAVLAGDRASGVFDPVLDGASATHLLIVSGGENSAVLVDLGGAGVERIPVEMWDHSRAASRIILTDAPIERGFSNAGKAAAVLRAHLDLATAWDSIGGARHALAEAIAYMQTRQQFDRPIGSFQALKHRAADLKVALEIAAALTRKVTVDFTRRADGWATAAAQAKLLACDTYRSIAEENIQFHGGIGFTWEHDAHLFFKRAWLNEVLGGTADTYRDRIAPAVFHTAADQKRGR